MQRSVTGSGRLRPLRAAAAAATTLIVASVALSGSPAYAINPPGIDPAAVPPDSPPGPMQPMKQTAYCTEVGVLPGTDFRVQPKYMDMLNLPEAWRFGRGAGVKVAVIDTGVAPHPRLPHLIPGGDYVMAGGDGLSDCDAHGTLVASMIAASPASGAPPGRRVRGKPLAGSDQRTTAAGAASADGDRIAAAPADRHDGPGRRRRRRRSRRGAVPGGARAPAGTHGARGARARHSGARGGPPGGARGGQPWTARHCRPAMPVAGTGQRRRPLPASGRAAAAGAATAGGRPTRSPGSPRMST